MNPAGTVRFCVWYSSRISGVAEPDDPTKKLLLTGGLGRNFNTYLDFMYHGSPVHFNHSIVKISEFGSERGDGSLTGCAGSIQKNESDFLIGVALYPFDDYDHVFQAQVSGQMVASNETDYQFLYSGYATRARHHVVRLQQDK